MTVSRSPSVCLYRRAHGSLWWRVDASVTPGGDILIISGDAEEWHAIVRGEAKDTLLRALRRTGDLTAGIGSTPEEEILARLHQHFFRDGGKPCGPFEEIKAFFRDHGVAWEGQFWASDGGEAPAPPPRGELVTVLARARGLLARPDNDFSWSSWQDADAALAEIDGLIAALEAGGAPDRATLALLFTVSGPMQEVSLASGWAREFVELAAAFDRAIAAEA